MLRLNESPSAESCWKRFYIASPFTAVCIDLFRVSPAVQGNICRCCGLYRLFCEAKGKVDIPWICFVCIVQFVESIDWCFSCGFAAGWRIKFLYGLYWWYSNGPSMNDQGEAYGRKLSWLVIFPAYVIFNQELADLPKMNCMSIFFTGLNVCILD